MFFGMQGGLRSEVEWVEGSGVEFPNEKLLKSEIDIEFSGVWDFELDWLSRFCRL